jgi:hypothetical protein
MVTTVEAAFAVYEVMREIAEALKVKEQVEPTARVRVTRRSVGRNPVSGSA